MSPEAAAGEAHARAALAGNPSDGYGGAVLAVTLAEYSAQVRVQRADRLEIHPRSPLVRAAVRRFAREQAPEAVHTAIHWSTSIPRSVGLGGSSAIVIAVLRALCELYEVALDRAHLAELALAIEVQDLGIAAGLQDRVAQAYGGVTFMDFAVGPAGYETMDPALLPPLLVAWRPDTADVSHAVHAPLRRRYELGEPVVLSALGELAALARRARAALLAGDFDNFARCVDGSFDQRQKMLTLEARHVEMVHRARGCGAAANYAGSGGAIIAVCADQARRQAVAVELAQLGCGTVAPALVAGSP
jgi:glucuronokinase